MLGSRVQGMGSAICLGLLGGGPMTGRGAGSFSAAAAVFAGGSGTAAGGRCAAGAGGGGGGTRAAETACLSAGCVGAAGL